MATINDSERQSAYDRLHRSPEIRAAVIRKLETLAERYPMQRLGQLLANAMGTTSPELFYLEDDNLLRMLSQLEITYGQFKAAGIKP